MNIFLPSVAGLLSGLFGAMGLGGGGVLIIYLTLFSGLGQITSQGINLIFFAFIAFISVVIYSYKKLIDWNLVLPTALLGIPGSIIGFYFSSLVDSQILNKLFGVLILIIGISQIFKKDK